jgi:hypothetical protein
MVDIHHYIRYMPLDPFLGRTIMTSSLKAYAPHLAWRLDTTPAALYERQRALVRDGMLEQPEGHGPGSGVQLGPYPVALLLVAVLATDSLSETAEKIRIFATAKSIAADGFCPLTGEPTFAEAIARVLDMAHHQHWRKIVNITVHRTSGSSLIKYEDNGGSTDSVFATRLRIGPRLRAPTKLMVDAVLTRDLIIAIAMDLKKIAESEQHNRSAALQRTEQSEERIRGHGRRTVRVKARRHKEGKKP